MKVTLLPTAALSSPWPVDSRRPRGGLGRHACLLGEYTFLPTSLQLLDKTFRYLYRIQHRKQDRHQVRLLYYTLIGYRISFLLCTNFYRAQLCTAEQHLSFPPSVWRQIKWPLCEHGPSTKYVGEHFTSRSRCVMFFFQHIGYIVFLHTFIIYHLKCVQWMHVQHVSMRVLKYMNIRVKIHEFVSETMYKYESEEYEFVLKIYEMRTNAKNI